MTSAISSDTNATHSVRNGKKPRVRLRTILKEAQREMNSLLKQSNRPDSTLIENYRTTMRDIESLLSIKQEICALGRERKKLGWQIAESESCSRESFMKSFYDIRREDGMERPEKASKNSVVLDTWVRSNQSHRQRSDKSDKKFHWTKNDWNDLKNSMKSEYDKSLRTKATLQDDVEALKSIELSQGIGTTCTEQPSRYSKIQGSEWLSRMKRNKAFNSKSYSSPNSLKDRGSSSQGSANPTSEYYTSQPSSRSLQSNKETTSFYSSDSAI